MRVLHISHHIGCFRDQQYILNKLGIHVDNYKFTDNVFTITKEIADDFWNKNEDILNSFKRDFDDKNPQFKSANIQPLKSGGKINKTRRKRNKSLSRGMYEARPAAWFRSVCRHEDDIF